MKLLDKEIRRETTLRYKARPVNVILKPASPLEPGKERLVMHLKGTQQRVSVSLEFVLRAALRGEGRVE